MYPAEFEYVRASSAQEAVDLLAQHQDAKLLAGGHSLIPMLKLRLAHPATLIDIGRIAEIRGICEQDDELRIGSLTTHSEIAGTEVVASRCRMLAEAAGKVGDPQVRNKGTIGGNIAHADPASDLPAVLVAAGATVYLLGPDGGREVAAADFFVELLTTAMQPGEIITEIAVPDAPSSAYLKVEHPASGYAVCGAAAVMHMEDGACTGGSLAFNGITPVVAEAWKGSDFPLTGTSADDGSIDAAVDALTFDHPLGDIHASGEYRVALAKAYGKRALKKARDR